MSISYNLYIFPKSKVVKVSSVVVSVIPIPVSYDVMTYPHLKTVLLCKALKKTEPSTKHRPICCTLSIMNNGNQYD